MAGGCTRFSVSFHFAEFETKWQVFEGVMGRMRVWESGLDTVKKEEEEEEGMK